MSEQKTTVYKLGRPIEGVSILEGCKSWVEHLGTYAVLYRKGEPSQGAYPLFAFRSIEALVQYKGWYGYGTDWVAWEAQAHGVSHPPAYILDTSELAMMDDFWTEVRVGISAEGLWEDFEAQATPTGTVLCDSITLTRLFTKEELIKIRTRLAYSRA